MLNLASAVAAADPRALDVLTGWLASRPGTVVTAVSDRLGRARDGAAGPDVELHHALALCTDEDRHFTADWLRHGHLGPILGTAALAALRHALADEVEVIDGALRSGINEAPGIALADMPPLD